MAAYQVKYWFESNHRDASGENVIETVEGTDVQAVAGQVEANLSRAAFTITPSFGPAQQGGVIVIHSAQVRYVEVIPVDRR